MCMTHPPSGKSFNPLIVFSIIGAGFRMLFVSGVPLYCKFMVVAALAYAISPLDVIPDFCLVIGWTDDIAVVLGLFSWALSLVPRGVLADNPMEKSLP
jgi:uncharacterized membrane protein YkvA (DUF1232 family)